MKKIKINSAIIALSALFCAIICILSQISVMTPFGIPLTLQTFAVSLCGCLLGGFYGTASVGVYVLLGALGLPIFSSFRGGAQILFGPTGGFIWGFFILAFFCGLSCKFNKTAFKLLFSAFGLLLCHLLGVLQFKFVSGNNFLSAFLISSLPYILKDILCLLLAFYTARQIRKKAKGLF